MEYYFSVTAPPILTKLTTGDYMDIGEYRTNRVFVSDVPIIEKESSKTFAIVYQGPNFNFFNLISS